MAAMTRSLRTCISLIALGAGVTFPLSASTPVAALAEKAPTCAARQIRETLRTVTPSATRNVTYQGWVLFKNVGPPCAMSETYIGIEAVTGPAHRPLSASTEPTGMTMGVIVLRTGQSARAEIVVARTDDPALRTTCQPKSADGLEVVPPYPGWPPHYFGLPARVLVCTGGSDNLGGGSLLPSTT
jgi:hypothetical protein